VECLTSSLGLVLPGPLLGSLPCLGSGSLCRGGVESECPFPGLGLLGFCPPSSCDDEDCGLVEAEFAM
jgi:hypothetical protein